VGTSETLRSVIDAGKTSKRLDELSAARVIGKAALQVHAAQQKAGAGKAIGPVAPTAIALASAGDVSLALPAASTLGYSAPEVVNGAAGDRRSDVFSLGVVMWEALTHQRLFEAMNDAAVKAAVVEREIKPPSELNANIPAELSAICMRALARNPADRFQSAKSMAVEIEEFLEESGYADNDEQIAAFLAELGKPKPEKKVTLPPATTPTPPPGSLPSVLTAPTQPPSILKSPGTTPPPASSPGIALANALATATAPATDKATTAPGMGASTLVETAPAASARTANGTAPPPAVPMPPILPGTNGDSKKINPSQTVLGIGALTHAPAEPAKPEPPKPEPAKDEVKTLVDAPKPVEPSVTATPVAIAAQTPAPPVVPASPRASSQPAPKPPEDAAPATAMIGPESRPNPAAVVALPGRDSKGDVLAGWGWGTDSHQAITDDSDLDLPTHGSNKKLLLYLLGGGLVFTLMVVVIAFGFGGSKKKKAPPPVAATQEWNAGSQTGSAAAGSADTGSAVVADNGSAMTAAATGSAMAAGSADTGSAAGSAMVATTGSNTGSAAVATTGPVNPYPDTPDTTAKTPEPKKVEPPPPPPKKVEPPPPPPKKVEPPPPPPKAVKKVETPKVAKTETPKTVKKVETPKTTPKTETSKGDAESAYRTGLQQFARGDTTGALASLRTSLAANPNYAPTWRGLGLVFEKLGEKDQARAAFKRYLQLAPSAGDADNIRSRLERLGS
jgi:outer membrane biosynthesis protein TonB